MAMPVRLATARAIRSSRCRTFNAAADNIAFSKVMGYQRTIVRRVPCLRQRCFSSAPKEQLGETSAGGAAAAQLGDISARTLLGTARRRRLRIREATARGAAGGAQAEPLDAGKELREIVSELQAVLQETAAPPTYSRLVETSLDPCWDWSASTPRLRNVSALVQALEALERRLLQVFDSESFADARFGKIRMDLGAGHVRTSGTQQQTTGRREVPRSAVAEQRLTERQFLSHAGVAGRTPSERFRSASRQQLERGTAAAADYRAGQAGIASSPAEDMEEVEQRVEDKIQIAMAKGEFDKLEGRGRPLQRLQPGAENPFLDRGDRLGFDLLQRHGFAPEWIEQQKEIRTHHERARRNLAAAWLDCGEEPSPRWLEQREAFREAVNDLNRRVRNYNLVCPAASQMPPFIVSEEVRRVRQGARQILGHSASGKTVKSPASTAHIDKPRRLMTPFREVLSARSSTQSQGLPDSGRSLWSRVADAIAFRKGPA